MYELVERTSVGLQSTKSELLSISIVIGGNMRRLSTVENFGAVDADNDDLLLASFEDHEAFKDVINFKRFLIIGRKGSGKTAIFKKMLTTSGSGYFCFGHTFSDYPWHYHDLQARSGIPDFDKYTHSWKYLVLLTLSKIILNQDQSLPVTVEGMEAMVKVEKFVVDSYGSRDPDVTQIFTPSKRLKLKPTFELNWQILKAGVSPESLPIEELPTIVQDVNLNLMKYCLECLNPAHQYFICFDQLDLGFDLGTGDYKNRLIGLLLACRDINLAAKRQGKRLFVVVFLRDDIYNSLQFEDKNKITENFVSVIEWDSPRTNKTLRQLMEKRFSVLLGEEGDTSVFWQDVFNEEKEMPGRQTKYRHISDRTYLRPRDVIKFCNTALKNYKNRISDPVPEFPDTGLIENLDIHKSRLEYSTYFLNELDDEVHKHLPEYRSHLDILRSLGVWQFTLEQFARVCRDFGLTEEGQPIRILQDFYDFSIIGFYKLGGRGYGGSEYIFKYKEPQTKFDANATRFRLHPGFLEALNISRTSDADSASPDTNVSE